MSEYGGVGMEDIRRWMAAPMVTVIRLLGCRNRRLDPSGAPPDADADPDADAAIVAMLEKKIKKSKVESSKSKA